MSLPTKVINAIKWYAKQYDLTPAFSAYPQMRFRKINGDEVMVNALNILVEYDNRKRKK